MTSLAFVLASSAAQPGLVSAAEIIGGLSVPLTPALIFAVRFSRRVILALDRVESTTTRELTHNGGGSTKDLARDARDSARAANTAAADAAALAEKAVREAARLEVIHAETSRQLRHDVAGLRTVLVLHMHDSSRVLQVWQQAMNEHGLNVPNPVTINPAGIDIADAINDETERGKDDG